MKIIKVKDVSVCYRMPKNKIVGLKQLFVDTLTRKLKFNEFWALNDVSFTVKKGEIVGLIGRNGAGKSTMLKVIAGIQKPTKGTVEVDGNVVPMLELGSGFDMELSGAENIYLNGAILGYSQEFLKSQYDRIVDFSELHEFMNVPIRNYSSGMLMRLAFSIATAVNPNILIVDEVLAVGDQAFQHKSRARMMEMMKGGTTVLLVSHSSSQIRELCNRAVWLDKGKMVMFGNVEQVCDAYEKSI